jgi:hypothetical protein
VTQSERCFLGIDVSNLVIFISIITAGLYFDSIAYFHSYFSALGIPQIFLQLPLEFYLVNGVIPILIALFFCAATGIGIFLDPENRLTIGMANSVYLLTGMAFIFSAFQEFDNFLFQAGLILIGIYGIFYFGFLVYKKNNVIKKYWLGSDAGKITVILLLLAFTSVMSLSFGDYMGNRAVNGIAEVSHVDFKFENNSTTEINDVNLSLFFYDNGNYYAFSKNLTTGKLSEVYIIPEKTVEYAKIKWIVKKI